MKNVSEQIAAVAWMAEHFLWTDNPSSSDGIPIDLDVWQAASEWFLAVWTNTR